MISGNLDLARKIAETLVSIGYPIRMSRRLVDLKEYIRERFDGTEAKRTGLLISSKFRHCSKFGVNAAPQNFYYYGEWYEEPTSHQKSGSRLETAISEFGCQGLELDLPLLSWGPDLRWEVNRWKSYLGRARVVKDPHRLRLNAYRVLLTRGRDGLAIFVPPTQELDETSAALKRAGVEEM